jgi:putative membrane protein
MQILLIFSFIIAFIAILFAVQNTSVTTIRFLWWETEGSIALVLFIALVAGALISYLATAPSQIKGRMAVSNQRKRISELENQLNSVQGELEETKDILKQIEEKTPSEEDEVPEGEENS